MTGRLYFTTDEPGVDSRIVSVNPDGSGQTTLTTAVVTAYPEEVGVDTAAGLYFVLSANGNSDHAYLLRGSLGSAAAPTIVVDFADALIINTFQVDAANRKIYVGYQDGTGQAPANTGIRVYSYDAAGTLTDNGFLVTSATDSRGQEAGYDVLDPHDFAIDPTIGRLFYSEYLSATVPANGLFRLDLANPTVTTQLVSQAQFPDDGSVGFILDVEVDTTTDLVYFTTESRHPYPDVDYVASQNALWYISENATNGTAVKVTLTGLPGGNHFYPGDMTFDQDTRRLYIESEDSDLGAAANNDAIYVFQLDAAGTGAALVNTITLSPQFSQDFGNFGGLTFAHLVNIGTVSGTATVIPGQGAAVKLLTAALTFTDIDGSYLASATVRIIGGTFNSGENSFDDDDIGYGAGMTQSGTIGGTNITLSWDQATGTLTLTGYDTFAHYQAALANIHFQSTGNDPTNGGLNPTRTLTWTINDGTTSAAGEHNSAATTITIVEANGAPVADLNGAGGGIDYSTTYLEDGAAVGIGAGILVSDPNAGDQIESAVVKLTDRVAGDSLAFTTPLPGGFSVVATNTAGSITLAISGTGTSAQYQSILASIVYSTTSQDPTIGGTDTSRTITVTVNDGTVDSAAATAAINITAVNDAAVAQADVVTIAADTAGAGSVFANNGSGADFDLDGPPLAVSAVNGLAGDVGTQIALASGALLTLSADGTFNYDANGQFDYLVSAATAAATGAVNTSAPDSFGYTLAGGSSAAVKVTVTGVDGVGDELWGSSGDNTITDTIGADYFDLSQGGNDTANGAGGNDAFYFGAAFTAADTVIGGAGNNDQIGLEGNYTGANALVLGAGTISGVEVIALLPGFDYDLTTVDANVPNGGTLKIFAGGLGVGDDFTFDGSAETDGNFMVFGGLGTDVIKTGAGVDGIYFGPGKFDPTVDRVDGGSGINDQLALDGDYTLTLDGVAIKNIDVIALLKGIPGDLADYNLTLANSLTLAGQTTTIWGSQVDTVLTVNGAAESDGALRIFGGTLGDTLTGGAGDDWFWGGLGGDTMTGGLGADTFMFESVAQSTIGGHDQIVGFDDTVDKIDLPGAPGVAVTSFATGVLGTLNAATLESDIGGGSGGLGAHQALVFTANGGDLNGHTFLVVDANGTAGHQAAGDFLIEFVAPVSPLDQLGMFA